MAETHLFNFFPGSIHSGKILKTFSLFATRYKNTYVPTRNVWLSKLYFDISTAKQKQCLTVDTCTINDLGPGKFRTQADNNIKQICYYSRNKSDTHSNSFLATRKQTLQNDIKFSINKIITSLNSSDVRYINLTNESKNVDNDTFQSKLQQLSGANNTGRTPADKNRTGDRNERGERQGTERGRVSKNSRFLSG